MPYFHIAIKPTRSTFPGDGTEAELNIIGDHFNMLTAAAEAGEVFMAGRTQEDQPTGYVVVRKASLEEAESWMRNDPAVVSGIFEIISIKPFGLAVAGRKVSD